MAAFPVRIRAHKGVLRLGAAAVLVLALAACKTGGGAEAEYTGPTDRLLAGSDIRIETAPPSNRPFLEIVEDAQRSVVTVRAKKMFSRERRSGSGFFIGRRGYLLTNEHVIRGSGEVAVRLLDGREVPAQIIAFDRGRDVALLKAADGEYLPLPLKLERPRLGASVFVLGSPLGYAYQATLSRGIVTGSRSRRGRTLIQSDADILPGSSGGPLIDQAGNVIGIAKSGVRFKGAITRINFFIPVAEAITALNGTLWKGVLAVKGESNGGAVSPPPKQVATLPGAKAGKTGPSAARKQKARVKKPAKTTVAGGKHAESPADGEPNGLDLKALIVMHPYLLENRGHRGELFQTMTFDRGGRYSVQGSQFSNVLESGKWRVTTNGKLCLQRRDVDESERCFRVQRRGRDLRLRSVTDGRVIALYSGG